MGNYSVKNSLGSTVYAPGFCIFACNYIVGLCFHAWELGLFRELPHPVTASIYVIVTAKIKINLSRYSDMMAIQDYYITLSFPL